MGGVMRQRDEGVEGEGFKRTGEEGRRRCRSRRACKQLNSRSMFIFCAAVAATATAAAAAAACRGAAGAAGGGDAHPQWRPAWPNKIKYQNRIYLVHETIFFWDRPESRDFLFTFVPCALFLQNIPGVYTDSLYIQVCPTHNHVTVTMLYIDRVVYKLC
jgi:hypothetical protein